MGYFLPQFTYFQREFVNLPRKQFNMFSSDHLWLKQKGFEKQHGKIGSSAFM